MSSQQLKSQFSLHWKDFGPSTADRVDYPDFAKKLCVELLAEKKNASSNAVGILICGSGQGMAMTANRFHGIRAAVAWNEESARLSRAHNDANILCLGARLIDQELALKIVETFLTTSFEGGRHSGRVAKLDR